MGRPLRDTDPRKVHLISTRTAQAELLLVPDATLNSVIGGIIARYAEMYGIEIFAYCILSNHYHILCRAPHQSLWQFGECINKEISKRINKLLSRRGSFWGRRYDDQIAIDEVDALEGLLYVVTNPVKHGLVSRPEDWPGLTCFWQLRDEKARTYYFFLYTEYRKALSRSLARGEPLNRADFEIPHDLKLTPLPVFSHLSQPARKAKLDRLIKERVTDLVKERQAANLEFLGRKRVLSQPKTGAFPNKVSCSPRPRCYTKNPSASAKYRKEEKCREESYRQASRKYRAGQEGVLFPPNCLKPPMHHRPRKILLEFAPP